MTIGAFGIPELVRSRFSGGSSDSRPVRNTALGLLASAFVLLIVPTFLGSSAATPPLGARTFWPPYDLGLTPAPGLVVVLLATGFVLAALGLWQALRAIRLGWAPRVDRVLKASTLMTLALVLVPPFGSADHLSYAAYGRISDLGADPYVVAPNTWPTSDAVIAAVEAPWEGTPSVYGPIATALFQLLAALGAGELRMTVWLWQAVVGVAFLATGALLYRLAGQDETRRARVAVLWLLNPALLAILVGGAHLDVLAVAAGVAGMALLILPRRGALLVRVPLWVLAGAAFGLAAGTKLPYLAVAAAAWWAIHRRPPAELAVATTSALVGGLAVLLPAHVWAGPHAYDQTQKASHFVSIASPWRTVISLLEALFGQAARNALPLLFAALAVLVILAARRIWQPVAYSRVGTDVEVRSAARALLVLSLAYPLAAPYVLPWYDAPVWIALVLADVPLLLEGLLVARLAVMAISYVPGRADVPSSLATEVMLGVRHVAAPVLVCWLLGWLFASAWRSVRSEGLRISRLRTRTNASASTVSPRTTMAVLPIQPGVPHSHDH
ncbi:hypothetical protein LR394_06155 [Kineosporia babensis]|uniref:DUF2029 domain-containing protein n=1 Tax=Kineosporia babensis TaxID=499548 RepID=A0A9X1NB45_9ACTN|nr:hypothetical protein [Kineosporia babensis]MCD5310470.1 hypothetical protein [Kineosporia babensis]